jgi:methionine synthase II (cobalamin-independent)
MDFRPMASATVIGSFPHTDPAEACGLVFKRLKDIPAWPQLPRRDFLEDMNVQYSRSLPCLVVDHENRKVGFDTSRDLAGELERFYTRFIEEDLDYFGLDECHAAGFECFLDSVRSGKAAGARALKGQISGPLTLGLMTDAVDGKYALYKPDLFDAVVKCCAMNARWQARKLRESTDSPIVFFDEPSLSIIGSGFYSVDKDLVAGSFREIIDGIRREGGLTGTHCCGNADWDDLMDLDLDIISFDAADDGIADKFITSRAINAYLEKGGCIAWGIVPTLKEKIEKADRKSVETGFRGVLKRLAERGLSEDTILERSMLTPSCGTATLSIELAEKVMELLDGLSSTFRGDRS